MILVIGGRIREKRNLQKVFGSRKRKPEEKEP